MARALRIEFEDAIYHITARGNRREAIFGSDGDREKFLALLATSLGRYRVELHAYVLLPNHFHLLVRTRMANLSRWMHWLMVAYAVWFNWRHDKAGHLFQGRYKSLLVEGGSYLLELSRYVHLNPVRGRVIGLGDPKARRERLRHYRWSSYGGYAGLAQQSDFVTEDLVLGEFGTGSARDSKRRYRRFVEEGLIREVENPLEAAQWQAVIGSERFLQRIKDRLQEHRPKRREVTALRRGTSAPEPRDLVERVAKHYDVKAARLLNGREYGLEARNAAMWVVWQLSGLSLREVGLLFGGIDYAAVAQRIRRIESRSTLRTELESLLKQCQKV